MPMPAVLRHLQAAGQDLRYALREIVSRLGFAVIGVLTLGLSIGALTTYREVLASDLSKRFPIRESVSFTFQAEMLNVFNHPNFQQGPGSGCNYYCTSAGYQFPFIQGSGFGLGGILGAAAVIWLVVRLLRGGSDHQHGTYYVGNQPGPNQSPFRRPAG